MPELEFYGWKVGMKKISFTKMLHDKCNLSLRDAKDIKDKLVNEDESIILYIESDELAKEVLSESNFLGAKCRIIE